MTNLEPRDGFLRLDGWAGITETPVKVVGETPKRYLIQAIQDTRLAGRRCYLAVDARVLVPKHAVRLA